MQKKPKKVWGNFGFEYILNGRNESIIVMIGGNNEILTQDIHLFNCVTHEFTTKKNVCNILLDTSAMMNQITACIHSNILMLYTHIHAFTDFAV